MFWTGFFLMCSGACCAFSRFCIGGGDCFCDQSPICTQKGKNLRILWEQMDTVRYIQETKRWLSRLVLQAHIHTLQSDLAHAYYLQGQYDVAIRILWEIQPPRSKRMNKMLYYNKLTCYYLAVGDLKSAAACFQDGEQTIEKTSKTSLFFVAPIILICSTPKRSCSTIKVRFKRAKSFFCRRSKGGIQIQQLAVTSI